MWIPLIVGFIALLMIGYEIWHQRSPWPKVRGWWLRAALLNAAQVGTVYLAGWTWDKFLMRYRLWSLDFLSDTVSALLGYLVITFVFYWWHRARHQSDFLWRWCHQVHHSPKRLEVITAFYKHPFELVADSVLSSLILYPLMGLNPQAASYAILLSALAELFYHWNVKTPYWIGFIFQRPESHCVHHEEGLHHYNYADLPLWDMLFGTFRNPKKWERSCGLGEEELRLGEMLLGIDVLKTPKKKRASLIIPTFLVGLGLLHIVGELTHSGVIKGIAMTSLISPAPKVFCQADSLETFSSRFWLEWNNQDGEKHRLQITPEQASQIKGPYNRRNVYGAILSYGPVLEANPRMRPLYEAVLHYSTSGKAPLLRELGIDSSQIEGPLWITVEPRAGFSGENLHLTKRVDLQ